MQPIIYDVAVSLDGFIAGPDGDVSLFDMTGPVAEDYGARLAAYSTAIMGRATYEFGYAYGLAPGQNPYPGLATVVFSTTLETEPDSEIDVVPEDWETAIAVRRRRLRRLAAGTWSDPTPDPEAGAMPLRVWHKAVRWLQGDAEAQENFLAPIRKRLCARGV